MMSKSRSAVLAAVAGCCVPAVRAQELVRVSRVERITPASITYQGVTYPVRAPAGDVPQLVYDNGTTATTGFFYTTSTPATHVMDQMTFTPGPGAGQPVLLTSMVLPISTKAVVANPTGGVDVLVAVWNETNATATPVNTQQAGATLRVAFNAPAAGWAINTIYISNPIDLSTLPGGGLQTTDDNVGVEFSYVPTGGNPPTYNDDFTVGFWGDTNLSQLPNPGNSDASYWRDVSGDGIFQGPTETRGFAAPALGNFVMSFTGEVGGGPAPCYANCDGSTTAPILNVNDFICFQGLYAAADTRANCDASTTQPVLNVNDFICFQGRYAAGCP